MVIKIKKVILRNFKGARERTVTFFPSITIAKGPNACGKTTLVDGILWVFFNKDSEGNTSFEIRYVGLDGKEEDNTEISVEVVLEVDGKEITLKKVQKQKWTKHRGSSAPTYEGNVNSYEVDGFPQSEKEFKAKIAEIIEEDNFKLLSDLRYFSSLDWKKKKEILLRLIGDVTDQDVLDSDPDHWLPIRDDVLAAGVEKTSEKAKKSLRELNKSQKELPVRIDELNRQIRAIPDTSDAEAKLEELDGQIKNLDEEIRKAENDSSVERLQKEILDTENKRASIKRAVEDENRKKKSSLYDDMTDAKTKLSEAAGKTRDAEIGLEIIDKKMESLIRDLDACGRNYHLAEEMTFDEKDTICRTCGQILPKNKISEIKDAFEKRRADDMERYKKQGWEIRQQMDSALDTQKKMQKEHLDCKAKQAGLEDAYEYKKKLYEFFVPADPTSDPDYNFYSDRLDELTEMVIDASTNKVDELKAQRRTLTTEYTMLTDKISEKTMAEAANDRIRERKTELELEQRENGAKIALCEQKVILLEEFSIKKSEMLSRKITQEFEGVSFSLFNQQINGGLVEECEITYNGVKYKDMNSGHRIVCALEIIKTFQKKLGIFAPVFVDNAETINDYNIPQMDCQMILLKVSDDKELTIKEAGA